MLVCPICFSKDIVVDAGGYTGKYKCKKCGYIGTFIIDMSEEDYEKLKEFLER